MDSKSDRPHPPVANDQPHESLWELATYRMPEVGDGRDRREIDRDWLERARLAAEAGNPGHLYTAVEVCRHHGWPPPAWYPVQLRRLMMGKFDCARRRRNKSWLVHVAAAILDVQGLTDYTLGKSAMRHRGKKPKYLRGEDAFDGVSAAWYELAAQHGAGHPVRAAAAMRKAATRARKKLADRTFRDFVGASFPPEILDRLVRGEGFPREYYDRLYKLAGIENKLCEPAGTGKK